MSKKTEIGNLGLPVSGTDRQGLILFLWVRALAIFFALTGLMGLGILELCSVLHFTPLLRRSQGGSLYGPIPCPRLAPAEPIGFPIIVR